MARTIRMEALADDPAYVSIENMDGIRLDLRYEGSNNFLARGLYAQGAPALLHRQAATQLQDAARALRRRCPGYRLLIFDALRPGRVQRVLWNLVRDTPQRLYVADPERGSIHSFGMAVDLGLEDARGRALDMGTGFDDFTVLAQPRYESEMCAAGLLSARQLQHRRLLRACMHQAGFRGIETEWWHFEADDPDWVRATMPRIE